MTACSILTDKIKLKYKDIRMIKIALTNNQNGICAICYRDLSKLKSRDICLDHNHDTGRIRAVLCRSCNAIEGKVHRMWIRYGLRKAEIDYKNFLLALKEYAYYPETQFIHPKYKTKEEKKMACGKKKK